MRDAVGRTQSAENRAVDARAAIDAVVAAVATDDVIACAAVDDVRQGVADEGVVGAVAIDGAADLAHRRGDLAAGAVALAVLPSGDELAAYEVRDRREDFI